MYFILPSLDILYCVKAVFLNLGIIDIIGQIIRCCPVNCRMLEAALAFTHQMPVAPVPQGVIAKNTSRHYLWAWQNSPDWEWLT